MFPSIMYMEMIQYNGHDIYYKYINNNSIFAYALLCFG